MKSYSAQYYRRQNYFQSLLLLLAMLSLLSLIGGLIAGFEGVLWASGMALVILITGPRISPYFILRLYRARLIPPVQAAHLYNIIYQLADRAEIEYQPALYYLPSQILFAFTIGLKKDACIVISDALLRTLNERELTAVLAHEISHIRNHDLLVMMAADVLSRLTSFLALCGYLLILVYLPVLVLYEQFIPWILMLVLILAPNLSAILQLALSRTREFNADLVAAQLTGDPIGLANALRKIDYYQHSWIERIFLPARRAPDPSVLRTHPNIDQRVKRLNDIASEIEHNNRSLKENYSSHWLDEPTSHKPRKRLSGLWY